jgi:hypothetical protein
MDRMQYWQFDGFFDRLAEKGILFSLGGPEKYFKNQIDILKISPF